MHGSSAKDTPPVFSTELSTGIAAAHQVVHTRQGTSGYSISRQHIADVQLGHGIGIKNHEGAALAADGQHSLSATGKQCWAARDIDIAVSGVVTVVGTG